jgi:hypothetical protein
VGARASSPHVTNANTKRLRTRARHDQGAFANSKGRLQLRLRYGFDRDQGAAAKREAVQLGEEGARPAVHGQRLAVTGAQTQRLGRRLEPSLEVFF